MSKHKIVNWLIFLLLSVIWGSSFILMKKSAEVLTGWQIGSVRIVSAGIVFLPLALVHIFKIPIKKIPVVLASGVLGNLFPAFLFAIAIEKRIDSSLAGILNSLTPLCVIVIGILFFKAKMHNRKIAGVLVGFIGLLILSLSKGSFGNDDIGFTMLILLATIMYGFNVNIVSHYLKEVNPVHMATVSISFIAIPAAFVAWHHNVISIARYDADATWPLIASSLLGIVATAIATALFYLLIRRAGGLFASLVTYAIPVISIFWGIWDHETITIIQLGCLALILSGVYLANK